MNLPATNACSLNLIYNTLHSKLRMLYCWKKNIEKERKNTSNSITSADNKTSRFVKLSLRSENFSEIYLIYLHLSIFFCTFAQNCKAMFAQLTYIRLCLCCALVHLSLTPWIQAKRGVFSLRACYRLLLQICSWLRMQTMISSCMQVI